MVFVISMMIGAFAAALRSAFAYALVAFLIVAAFALATLISGHGAHWLSLLSAMLGYNMGIAAVVTVYVVARRRIGGELA